MCSGCKMLPARTGISPPVLTSEGLFPLGPFPRHIWTHSNTPQDGLDEACHEIWKRVQQLSKVLQPPRLGHTLRSDLSRPLRTDTTNIQSSNYLLDEPEGLDSIYRAVIRNTERQMKLRALCDAQLSAKSVITSLQCSAKPHKNSKGLEDGGTRSMEGNELKVPFLLKYTDTVKGAGDEGTAEKIEVVKEFIPNTMYSSAKSGTAVSSTTAAERKAAGQKQQLPPSANIFSKTDSNAATKNPVTTATQDKKHVKYNTGTSGFSTTSMITALNQPVWQSLSFPPFPNPSNFPQFQGPYLRVRIPYEQALHPSCGSYSRQVAPYSPQQIFQPPYSPMLSYITLVQPGYLYQLVTTPTLSSNIQDLPVVASNKIQYPFALCYGFGSRPGGAVMFNLNYCGSESYVQF